MFTTTAYDHFQVICITEGQLHLRLAGTEQVLTPGTGVVLRIGSAFQLACPDVAYRGVGVNVFEQAEGAYQGLVAAFVADRAVHTLATMILQEVAQPDAGTDQVLEGLGIALCWHALRLAGASSLPSDTPSDWAERARQAILATLTTGRSVHDVLSALPLSYRQLARHFSAHFGCSPKQYQQHCRLDEVKRLLRDTPLSITTIAHEYGYPSSQHLCTEFHRAVGCTPVAYRRQLRK